MKNDVFSQIISGSGMYLTLVHKLFKVTKIT